ncbi:MAG: hypothetical protein WCQ82_03350 [Bacteroidaceae bacterium]
MNRDRIYKLLEDFYEGSTSRVEEEELYQFFLSPDVPEELLQDKTLFLQFKKKSAIAVPADLSQKLSVLIDREAAKGSNTISFSKRKRILNWAVSIAAAFLVLLAVKQLYTYNGKRPMGEIMEPALAQVKAQKALQLVSVNLNKGITQWSEAQVDMHKVVHVVNKHIK